MEKNKTGKYLKYAIGEIILVVFGILIALQINNANEHRKNRVTEITILKNLQEDINRDTLDIQFNLKHHKTFFTAEKELLNLLQSEIGQVNDSLDFSNALGTPLMIALHKSTFQNLQNNNNSILSNNKLRKEISRFYDFFHFALTVMENEYSAYQTYSDKKPFFKKYFKITEEKYILKNDASNSEEYYNPNFLKQKLKFANFKGARVDEGFKIELNESIHFKSIKIGFYEDMLNRISELNELFEIELKNLEN